MASFTKTFDSTLKTLLYTRFGDVLGISAGSGTQAYKINRGVVQVPQEIALRALAEKRGEDFLEFINFWRVGTGPAWDRQRTPLARRGMYLSTVDGKKVDTVHAKAQPVDLNYNVWFWSKDLDKIYECIEEYIFWQHDNPTISITYDDLYTLQPHIHFGEIVDESTVPEEYEKGRYFVFKMPIKIDGWIIKGLSFKTISKIVLTLYDKDEVSNYSEILVEDSSQDTELEAALRMFRAKLYAISVINLVNNSITTPKDRSEDFTIGEKIRIENSTGNGGEYTITAIELVGVGGDAVTNISLTEILHDSTADGNIYQIGD